MSRPSRKKTRRASVVPQSFYDRPVAQVAPELLGCMLVRRIDNELLYGRIVETEAYLAKDDPACHSYRGQTRRNSSMFGPPGHAYVYAIHSRWCLNVVTEKTGVASAVLIRAVEPLVGLEEMARRRKTNVLHDLARGPGRLCEAFDIDRRLDAWPLFGEDQLWIRRPTNSELQAIEVGTSPRIGVTSAHDLRLRFFVKGSRFVSGPKRLHAAFGRSAAVSDVVVGEYLK